MKYLTQLEPNELVSNFLTHPPQDFTAWQLHDEIPAFTAHFDLLTTADHDLQRKVRKLPFFNKWQKFLPIDFADINEYLGRLSYQRRKNFRRKLKSQQYVEINCLHSGDGCFFDAAVLEQFYQLYLNVYQQSDIHFDLLTKPFFTELLQDVKNQARIFTYYHHEQLVGYNICFIVNNMLVDKYIGFDYPLARDLNLYFLSWFYNLDYARQQGLDYYVAGWTDPEVKSSLGAKFTFTKHMVYVRNPLLRNILKKISSRFEQDKNWQENVSKQHQQAKNCNE